MLSCKGTASPPSSRPRRPQDHTRAGACRRSSQAPRPGRARRGCRRLPPPRSQAPGPAGELRGSSCCVGEIKGQSGKGGGPAGRALKPALISALDLTRQPAGRNKHAHRHGTRTPQNTGHVAARCITEASSWEMPVRRADLG